ncbi:hypothetical protein GQF42_03355 [Streptomyces broussonetiae]|uniref:Uncharacterized protein n=1 Tax=Streptomyces broussonetiae TaxID=2686304 RepID=A0A6I6N2K9_9ACTN|nr:hypothetical protein [Streptomyces broussonetiae]QHA02456.1 hypothetical protein GQF42_03355 [Streptomyces broussonetiae]
MDRISWCFWPTGASVVPVPFRLDLTPERAARLVPFDHAARRLSAGQSAARVAADIGCADQPRTQPHLDAMTCAGITLAGATIAP